MACFLSDFLENNNNSHVTCPSNFIHRTYPAVKPDETEDILSRFYFLRHPISKPQKRLLCLPDSVLRINTGFKLTVNSAEHSVTG